MERKAFVKGLFSSITVLSIGGCFTPMLYKPGTYDEAALAFLVTEDGARLVVLGEQYHYIFDDVSPSLREILLSPFNLRTVVVAVLANFYVDSDNVVTGDYYLSLSSDASDEQRKRAVAAGFALPTYFLSGHLKGVRYSAKGFPLPSHTQIFAQRHEAQVRAERSKTTKILLTPVTVAADGVLILGGLALLLLILAGYGRALSG